MSIFIAGGSRLACPQCRRLQTFERSILTAQLPVTIRCGCGDCGYSLIYTAQHAEQALIFPKIDPHVKATGSWVIEIQSQHDYWRASALEGKQISFRERAEGIAGHLAGGLQLIASLQYDLQQLADTMLAQFEGKWGELTSFQRFWHPGHVNDFLKQPFLTCKSVAQDEAVRLRTRLILHPRFFVPELGFPLPAEGGLLAQLITPYTQFSVKLERWFQLLLDLPEPAELRVTSTGKIVGKDLFQCWADIPGTEPDAEHEIDTPSIRITDSTLARRWLATLGVLPWPCQEVVYGQDILPLAKTYFADCAITLRRAYEVFCPTGRLAYFAHNPEERLAAWEFAMSLGAFGMGNKLCLITDERNRDVYSPMRAGTEGRIETTMSRNFHWKVVKSYTDLELPWDSFKYVFVDYRVEMPPEILAALHQYQGRLVMIHTDPIMDTLEGNHEAGDFYSCVNAVFWEHFLPGQHDFNYDLLNHSVVSALLREWFGKPAN